MSYEGQYNKECNKNILVWKLENYMLEWTTCWNGAAIVNLDKSITIFWYLRKFKRKCIKGIYYLNFSSIKVPCNKQ